MDTENILKCEFAPSSSPDTTASTSEDTNCADACGEPKSVVAQPAVPSKSPERGTPGPRTKLGRARSRLNATTYGLFSVVVLLKGESQEEYTRLLTGLRKARKPADALEELLVEKLTTIAWRYRRVLLAEGAEIRKNKELRIWDQMNRKREETVEVEDIVQRLLDPGEGPSECVGRNSRRNCATKDVSRKRTRMERTRLQIEIAAGNIPDACALDRLLRAEANLNREFGRTLDQLERIQRARLGQSLPPRIEVDIKK